MCKITKNEKSISLLLGAGFSAPMGYPVGSELNEKLLSCGENNFGFSHCGILCINRDGTKPNMNSYYDLYFNFCRDVINYYNNNIKVFDYEEFYDYYKCEAKNDIRLKDFFVAQNYQFGKADFNDYLYQMDNIYNQLVTYYLEDSNGRNWYDNEDFCKKPIFNGYTGFLNCIEMLSKDYIVNVHTLNHDLFFERLNNTEWINGKLCDGFEELGSPFYGKLLQHNRTYMCRLSRYTGKYNEKIRLYKLHGSIDNYVYCTDKGVSIKGRVLAPDTYIKTRCGIGNADFYKEVRNEDGTLKYENCPVNYHSDFLTGITSKISRYKEPLLYEKLFKLFKKNLNEAEILIVIGYGFKDAEINHYILSEFGTQKQCFVINPYADDNFKKLITEIGINEILIEKQIENLSLSDIGFMKHL